MLIRRGVGDRMRAIPNSSDKREIMFSRFMPKEGQFFEHFNAHAEQMIVACEALVALMNIRNESEDEAGVHRDIIDKAEKTADSITHETMRQLHTSFITPLDREEIHQLTTGLDDIIDLIQDVAHTVNLYNVRHITAEAINLSVLCRSCCERVRAAVKLLPSMDNGPQILKICQEIDHLESAADAEMRSAMSKLFREEPDVRELIKYKAIYELLEVVTDRCEDVANIIEGIVLENS